MQDNKCSWCKDGLCTVEMSVAEQRMKETLCECDGSKEMQRRCGRTALDTEK